MIDIRLTVNKQRVLDEVAQTTSYAGAKMQQEGAYDRIFTTDEDKSMLERFWCECKDAVCSALKKSLESEEEKNGTYAVGLSLTESFDNNLSASMERSLYSYFVMGITSKWYTFTNKEESAAYASEAVAYLEDIKRKAFYKKRPTRPIYK